MKKIAALFGFALLLTACGNKDGYAPSDSLFPTGSVLLLDAATVAASDPCTVTTWGSSAAGGFNGTLSSCTPATSGWRGTGKTADPYSMLFDGTNYVSTTLDVQATAMSSTTWIAWIKPNSLPAAGSNQMIFGIDNNGGAFNRSLAIPVGTSNLNSYFSGGSTASGHSVDTSWQFIALRITPTAVKLRKNGSDKTFGTNPTYPATALRFTIGKSNGGAGAEAFKGYMAVVAVFNRELTDAELNKACLAHVSRFLGATCN